MKVVLVLLAIASLVVTTLIVGVSIGHFLWSGEDPESMFYWGWLASCIKSGQDAGVDRSLVLAYCDEHMRWAYDRDVFNKLDDSVWVFPPEPIATPTTGN